MGKRNATQNAAQLAAKKPKVDVRLSGIVEVLSTRTEHLPETCRSMLVSLAPSLLTPSDSRHTVQKAGVEMIEATLLEVKDKISADISAAQTRLSELEGSKDGLMARISEAEAFEKACQEVRAEKVAALAQATSKVEAAEKELADKAVRKEESEKELAAANEEKASTETLIEEHFKTPMTAGHGPDYEHLKALVTQLHLEESLTNALPSSCAKTKEQRGQFDDLVLAEFEKALISHLATIALAAESKAAALPAVTADASAAESAFQSAQKEVQQASEAAKEAEESAKEAAQKLAEAQKAPDDIMPSIREVTNEHGTLSLELDHFESGTLAMFRELRDKAAAPEEEAAPAGA